MIQTHHRFYQGHVMDVLKKLPDESVHCCVTSPPYYGLRDYGVEPTVWGGDSECEHEWVDSSVVRKGSTNGRSDLGSTLVSVEGPKTVGAGGSNNVGATRQHRKDASATCVRCGAWKGALGLEPTIEMFTDHIVDVFREVRRILRPDGTIWLNLGDSYNGSGGAGGNYGVGGLREGQPKYPGRKIAGLKPKDLIGTPWRVAFALQEDGWWLRSDIVWCLSGGTFVYARTQKGDMPMTIKDLARLDPSTVKLWNGEKWTRILGVSKSPRRGNEIVLVLRSGERISCTRTHRFPTNKGLLEASEISVGDILRSVQTPEPDDAKSPSHIGLDAAWFAGLYLAEGSKTDKYIQISGHAKERERWDRVKRIAESYGGSATKTVTGNSQTIRVYGRMLLAVINELVSGRTAKDKCISPVCWRYTNEFLRSLLDGYLSGDGHWEPNNRRWRLGFTRNYNLERDLRCLSSRLGFRLTLNFNRVPYNGSEVPTFKGEIRFRESDHWNRKDPCEVVRIEKARARNFYDIGVEDEPHLFSLVSGVLTHNSKKAPMPESVTDRPTRSHEYVFLLTKSPRYFYDADAIREPGVARTIHDATGSGYVAPGQTPQGGNRKAPSGWDTDQGSHGTIHREGRSKPDKQRGHGRRHAGFNDRRDDMIKAEQAMLGRNKRDVWTIATQPFTDWAQVSRQVPVSADEADDDTKRIPSPDCPVHASSDHQDSNSGDGGHGVDSAPHTAGNGAHRAPGRPFCSAATDPTHGEDFLDESSGSPRHECEDAATLRSNESRRTDHETSTNQPCMPCAQTSTHTDDTSKPPVIGEPSDHTRENKSALVDLDGHPLAQTASHTARRSSCTCSFVNTVTESISHFATFPEALVVPCIKAGCPECSCPICGTPWIRRTHTEKVGPEWNQTGAKQKAAVAIGVGKRTGHERYATRYETQTITDGFEPTCECEGNDGSELGIVLDPFGGAGTVSLVAKKLGRSSIYIDLKLEYLKMAVKRCNFGQTELLRTHTYEVIA